jgi:non-canonical purine NTP pyrophosphatase (RdgB/HAM1 family)
MKPILFITGNEDKLREIREIIPSIQGVNLDLTEIQEIDAKKIITAKLAEAQKDHTGAFIVEDTSLYIDEMRGLPGPLIKWFVKAIGIDGIYKLTETFKSTRATARTLIGYADEDGNIHFFEGSISGTLVPPRGINGFGWDAIFQPESSSKTFAEMTSEEKKQCSMRRLAVEGLQQYLEKGGDAPRSKNPDS